MTLFIRGLMIPSVLCSNLSDFLSNCQLEEVLCSWGAGMIRYSPPVQNLDPIGQNFLPPGHSQEGPGQSWGSGEHTCFLPKTQLKGNYLVLSWWVEGRAHWENGCLIWEEGRATASQPTMWPQRHSGMSHVQSTEQHLSFLLAQKWC